MNISPMRISLQKIKKENRVHKCEFNSACACEYKKCHKCGWNPAVAEARTRAIMGGMLPGKEG